LRHILPALGGVEAGAIDASHPWASNPAPKAVACRQFLPSRRQGFADSSVYMALARFVQ
jgi:hypothetical protein